MPDYQNAKIYKLWSPQGDEIYIGATTQTLATRKAKHKHKLNCCSKILFEKYDDVRIELIEEYPCKNKMQLDRREGEHIRNHNCINKNIAGRTNKEYYEDNKEQIRKCKNEYDKEYREKNREKIRERHKKYYEKNKEQIREKQKEYEQTDAYKEMRSEYMREYRKKNKKK